MKRIEEIAVVTVGDRRAAGIREDLTGPAIASWARALGWKVVGSEILPDDPERISRSLRHWADERRVRLILTTGGTGLSPRDQTPEATLSVAERLVPGIPESIRAATGRRNRFAYLSRGVAVIRGSTLIVNLPGSPRAVEEYLDELGRILPHALQQLEAVPGTPEADRHPDPAAGPSDATD